jgi:hypothetical protein
MRGFADKTNRISRGQTLRLCKGVETDYCSEIIGALSRCNFLAGLVFVYARLN